MVLYLVAGDIHIPYSSAEIDAAYRKMFVPGRIARIFLTGNLITNEIYEYFKTICSEVHITRGEMDEVSCVELPETASVNCDGITIGMLHGHQVVPWGDKESLAMWQRRMDCDVLISGATHRQKVYEFEDALYVNPGSLTGAGNAFESDNVPSFVLLDINDRNVVAFMYQLEDGEVKVRKKELTLKKRA